MFQSFDSHALPEQGPPRLAALRLRLAAMGLQGWIVPRADVHQGEYVAARDERLQWLTGFTGSAGFCVVLPDVTGVFIDGRYRTQVKAQVDLAAYYQRGMEPDGTGHTLPEPRRDMKPAVAAILGIDQNKPLGREEIANLLNGQRADGADIPGKAKVDRCIGQMLHMFSTVSPR